MADTCEYEFPINLQSFTQKDLTEVKIFLNVLGGYFFKTPCICKRFSRRSHSAIGVWSAVCIILSVTHDQRYD